MIACTHVTMRVSLEGKGFVSAPWVPQYIIVVAVIVVLYWASVNLPISYGHKVLMHAGILSKHSL